MRLCIVVIVASLAVLASGAPVASAADCPSMGLMVCKCPGGETFEARAACGAKKPPYTWLQIQIPGQNPINAYATNPSTIDNKNSAARYIGPIPAQPFTVGSWGYDAIAPDPDCNGPAYVVDPTNMQDCPVGGDWCS